MWTRWHRPGRPEPPSPPVTSRRLYHRCRSPSSWQGNATFATFVAHALTPTHMMAADHSIRRACLPRVGRTMHA